MKEAVPTPSRADVGVGPYKFHLTLIESVGRGLAPAAYKNKKADQLALVGILCLLFRRMRIISPDANYFA